MSVYLRKMVKISFFWVFPRALLYYFYIVKIVIHQTHQSIGDFSALLGCLKEAAQESEENSLQLFPEMYLVGYPLDDLCLQPTFIERYLKLLEELNEWLVGISPQENIHFLLGGLHYQLNGENLPERIENVIFHFSPGKPMEKIYSKILLPNYDIFDEKKYFSPGVEIGFKQIGGINIALLICEDMWPSHTHQRNPVEELQKKGGIDLVVNLSASPYFLNKRDKRLKLAHSVSDYLQAPLAFVNRVGGEDEILFDGGSFLINSNQTVVMANFYTSQTVSADLPLYSRPSGKVLSPQKENTWESLFTPSFVASSKGNATRLRPLSSSQCAELMESITFGFQEYARKCCFSHFIVGLSGGIDSAVALSLIVLGMKEYQSVEAIFLPGHYSSSQSTRLSTELCHNLGIELQCHPIKFIHSAIKNIYCESFQEELDGLADENIQSRLRGALLYSRANQSNGMVINTSNKSELAVGYSTLYGDSVGALSLLGDLYKSEVYQLANFINAQFNGIIPQEIISRPPTAELKENQQDEEKLPPYHRLDPLLEGFLSYAVNFTQLSSMGFEKEEIRSVHALYKGSEYKRKQFCPIIKLKAKSFGKGHRVPLTDFWE